MVVMGIAYAVSDCLPEARVHIRLNISSSIPETLTFVKLVKILLPEM